MMNLAPAPPRKAPRPVAPCTECRKPMTDFHPYDDYMLTKEVWFKLHPEGYRGLLCHNCLNVRATQLNHTWSRHDFTVCLCYINRLMQPPALTDAAISRSKHPTFLTSVIEKQMRRITRLGVATLPPFWTSIND